MREWRPIAGWPGYEVSNDGMVRSYRQRGHKSGLSVDPHDIKPSINSAGYLHVTLTVDGRRANAVIHRLVLEAFVSLSPSGTEACHNDGNRTNNVVENLRWDTRKNNNADKGCYGRAQRGESAGHVKLTNDSVHAIRSARANGDTYESISRQYGVSRAHTSRICNGSAWGHLPLE